MLGMSNSLALAPPKTPAAAAPLPVARLRRPVSGAARPPAKPRDPRAPRRKRSSPPRRRPASRRSSPRPRAFRRTDTAGARAALARDIARRNLPRRPCHRAERSRCGTTSGESSLLRASAKMAQTNPIISAVPALRAHGFSGPPRMVALGSCLTARMFHGSRPMTRVAAVPASR